MEFEENSDHEILEGNTQRSLPTVLQRETGLFEVISIADTPDQTEGQPARKTAVVAKCRSCSKRFTGFLEVTSNFITHLKRKHPEKLRVLKENKRSDPGPSQTKARSTLPGGQAQLGFLKKAPPTIQETVDAAIMNYLVHTVCPLRTVDRPEFVKMITTVASLPAFQVKVSSRRVVTQKLEQHFDVMMRQIRSETSGINDIACTADIWSAQGRSFMGMTLHYFDDNLQRVRRGIACRRFKGKHTFDMIANSIESILDDYDISASRVKLLTTDNASNFVAAFREFGLDSCSSEDDPFADQEVEIDESDGETITDFGISLMPAFGPELAFRLPPHERCASHTLSLVATDMELKRFDKPEEVNFVGLYGRSMEKCTSLWNRLSRSCQSRETCTIVLKRCLTLPCATRWNSLYDSLKDLLRESREDINELLRRVKLSKLSIEEYEFLGCYKKILEPVAETLDILQGDQNVTYGCLLPAIRKLCSQLRELEDFDGTCEVLRRKALQAVETRFADLLDAETSRGTRALIAAISHPFFKLRFLAPSERDEAKRRFASVVRKACSVTGGGSSSQMNESSANCQRDDPLNKFFRFDESNGERSTAEFPDSDLEVEIARFLADERTDMKMLFGYERVLKVFKAYNVGLPSSAPVERLFSRGSLTLGDLRGCLNDNHVEMLVLFSYNNYEFK